MEAGAATPFLPIAPTPWRLFGSFLPVQKGTRHRGGEIPPLRTTNPIRNLSPHPPQCEHWGTFPPGGRLNESGRRNTPLRINNHTSIRFKYFPV